MSKTRLPPQDGMAEQAVLGSLLISSGEALSDIVDILAADGSDFYQESHAAIYRAMLHCQPVDIVTVSGELERRGKLQEIGGSAYLIHLVNAVPTSVFVRHYAERVAETATLRRFLTAPQKIIEACYEEAADSAEVYAKMRGIVEALRPDSLDDDAVLAWLPSLAEYSGYQARRAEREESGRPKLRFPWSALDGIFELLPGTLAVVAAESGAGKTAFGECAAEHWAERGFNVLFVHLELSHQVMLDRRACRQGRISMHELWAGRSSWELEGALRRMASWPGSITYLHAPGWTAARVAAVTTIRAGRQPIDVVIVDYFQKLAFDEHNQFKLNSAQARGQQVEAMKILAENLEVPVILMSQFSRAARMQTYRKSDFVRDTGELVERANYVIVLDRKIQEDGSCDPVSKVIVEKNTFGGIYAGHLLFDGARYLWTDLKLEPLC